MGEMTLTWRCWKLGLASLLAMGGAIADFGDYAKAQITPDGTLGAESSVVTPTNNNGLLGEQIDGGAIRGTNLFHSFEQFSVPTGSAAYFNNALDIQNIISRVTGGSVSNIDGLIRALGTANLFLINPNGIVFGPNAQLNVGGSFVASTATNLKFADGFEFSATASQTTPLLTISVPIGLQYGGSPGSILNQSRVYDYDVSSGRYSQGLTVQPGKTLALVGGNVSLDGGRVTALGGRVELGGVASSETVDLSVDGNDLRLSFPDGVERANVSLTQFSGIVVNSLNQRIQHIRDDFSYFIEVPVTPTGSIAINARNINIEESNLRASTAPTSGINKKAGEITLNASEAISFIEANASAEGGNGIIKIQGRSISLSDGYLSTNDFAGTSGSIFLQADDSISVAKSSILSNFSFGQLGGEINFKAKSIDITDGSQINAFGYGDNSVSGSIVIDVSNSLSLSNSSLNVISGGSGKGGSVNVKAGSFLVNDGGQINASAADGNSGNIVVNADSITISGVNSFERSSGLFTDTGGSGQGGDIRIDTNTLRVLDKAVVNVSTSSDGQGGDITINTRNLDVTGGAQILATSSSSGQAGNITVNATDKVNISGIDPNFFERSSRLINYGWRRPVPVQVNTISPESGLFVRVIGDETANAGNIKVTARSIRLDNQGTLSANTTAGQGSINLRSSDLILRNNSSITTNATGSNVIGGNITIDTGVIAALENSDISANAQDARGGQVIIDAQGIFGTELRNQQTSESDITATSDLGPEFSGTIEINTPDVDLRQGLVALPAELVDVAGLIAQGCPGTRGNVSRGESEFMITGRGGLPPNPSEALRSDAVRVDLGTPIQGQENRTSAAVSTNSTRVSAPTPIVEAQGWVIGANGEVILTARPPTVTPHSPWLAAADCYTSQNSS